MTRPYPIRTLVIAASAMASAIVASGCATVEPVEIESLETSSESLLNRVEFELKLTDIVLLNPYLEKSSPRADDFEAARLQLSTAAELLVDYSLSLIEIVRSEPDKAGVASIKALFTDTYASLRALPFIAGHMTDIDLDAVLADVSTQPDSTRALRALQPATQEIAQTLVLSVDEANRLFDLAFQEAYGKIIEEYRAFNAYADVLVLQRNDIMEKLLLVEPARAGDNSAWQRLLSSDDRLRNDIGDSASITVDSVDRAEEILIGRLGKIMETWGYMEPSYEIYKATLKELYQVDANARNILKVARYVVEQWEREQREMAAGRPAGFLKVTKDLAYLALRRAARP